MKPILTFFLFIPFLGFSQIPTDGLVAYWPFNGNANDKSSNSIQGTVVGATLIADKQNIANSAYYFDGSSSKIDCGNNAALNLSQAITISLWVKLKTIPSGQDRVLSKGVDSYVLYFQDDTTPIAYMQGTPVKTLKFGKSLDLNQWYHLAFTYNSNATGNNLKAFVDGTLSGQQETYGSFATDNLNLIIGNYVNSSAYGFHGDMDEVRIYNRALSETEIAQIYNSTFPEFSAFCNQLFCDDRGVAIGTTNIPDGYKLSVLGKIIAEGVKVEMQTNWPDYVFDDGYKLRSLQEVDRYIKEHHHLPEMPSATEIKNNGLDLGEMNAKLLQKIEELTLYQIELLKKLEQQENRIQSLENRRSGKKK
jgi:hypothetical protein